MSERRVLRWEVPVDDAPHEIGAGRVVHVDCRPPRFGLAAGRVEVWTEERTDAWPQVQVPMRAVQAFGTAHRIPDAATEHLGAALDAGGSLVWHLYEIAAAESEASDV